MVSLAREHGTLGRRAPAGRTRTVSDETFLVLPRQPSREDAPSVPGCGFGSGRHGCRLRAPSLGSSPPKGPRSLPCCSRASPFSPHTLSHAGETEAESYASSCMRRLPVGRAWTPRKPSETGWPRAGLVPCPSGHHREERADTEGSPRRRMPVLHGAHPRDVTSEGVTWHRRA